MSLSQSTLTDIANLVVGYIAENEGCRLRVYKDTRGIRTIGYGCNLEEPAAKALFVKLGVSFTMALLGNLTLTQDQANTLLVLQIFPMIEAADRIFPAFPVLPNNVKKVVVDMLFNLGEARFSEFKGFISAINSQKYKEAAAHLASSLWATQVKTRAQKAIALLESV